MCCAAETRAPDDPVFPGLSQGGEAVAGQDDHVLVPGRGDRENPGPNVHCQNCTGRITSARDCH